MAMLIPPFVVQMRGVVQREEQSRAEAAYNNMLTSIDGQSKAAADMANLIAQTKK